jgi:putative transposase
VDVLREGRTFPKDDRRNLQVLIRTGVGALVREGTPMLKVVDGVEGSSADVVAGGLSLLDEIVRDGARQMLAAALQAEVAAYVAAHRGELDENGHQLVVRNGYHAEREVTTAAGAVVVRQPRVNDKRVDEATGERKRFSSAILPAWSRKSPKVSEVLPLLYLHGLSTSDFGPALEQFLGTGAGLSAATIGRLTTQWQDEAAAFNTRSLAGTDYVYMWVDGIVRHEALQDRVEVEDLHRWAVVAAG